MSRKKGSSSLEDPEYEKPPEVWAKGYQTARNRTDDAEPFVIGQRWASDMEPELGIGSVTQSGAKRVTISFQDGACIREYSLSSPPLRRIRFRKGDPIRTRDGTAITVEAIEENKGLLLYRSAYKIISESDLSPSIRFTAPLDRLLAGHTDTINDFRLRVRALDLRNRLHKSVVRGFCGPRIELIPHQLYIASESVSRQVRRILLADEVGLGKTIEACLILHRLLTCGRAGRALVCVPQSIVHVWFVELLRKFNLLFRIIDGEYFGSAGAGGKNPFLDDQLVLCDLGFLSSDESAARCVVEAGWDVLIVDEAHHLEEFTRSFDLVKDLAARSRDVLLLTATPQQHGEQSHFARLRLLDPSRYGDFDSFVRESRSHRIVASVTSKLLDGLDLDISEKESMADLLGANGASLMERIAGLQPSAASSTRQPIIAELLDRFGIGRAMFRNTRAVVGGFPKRIVEIIPLKASRKCIENIRSEVFNTGGDVIEPVSDDPRFACLIDILKKFENEKILLICMHKETARSIERAINRHLKVNIGLFHEDLSLIQRDRNAAWFGEDEGARILICSEIGSEGRNFQFCHRLFMWDVPHDCELIEQRIGRLDRIGQTQAVIIHVPFISDSPTEVLCRFFHEGIGIFDATVPAAQEVYETMDNVVVSCAQRASPDDQTWRQDLDGLIRSAKTLTKKVSRRLEAGRDRLLEQHSFNARTAADIVRQIRESDLDVTLEQFMIDLFRFHGVFSEPLGKRTYKLWSESPLDESFPALRTSRPLVTFDRAYALVREDIEFMTADHPAVSSGLDMFLGAEKGNCCLAHCRSRRSPAQRGLFLEAHFVLECIAPPDLYVDRFLSPTPLRVMVDTALKDRSDLFADKDFEHSLSETTEMPVLEDDDLQSTLLPAMQVAAAKCAQGAAIKIIGIARSEMLRVVGAEADRSAALSKVNPTVRQEDIAALRSEIQRLDTAISGATPRLDSIRLIVLG